MPHKILKMPIYKQKPSNWVCVPYTIKALIEYYEKGNPSKHKLLRMCRTTNEGSHYPSAERTLRDYGLSLESIPFSMNRIKECVKNKEPILVRYSSGTSESHLSIICGWRTYRGTWYVILNDSWLGVYEIPITIFKVLLKSTGTKEYVKRVYL